MNVQSPNDRCRPHPAFRVCLNRVGAPRPGNARAYGYIVKDITPILKLRNRNRSAGDKEKVIDLLVRVTRASAETHRITEAMRTAKR